MTTTPVPTTSVSMTNVKASFPGVTNPSNMRSYLSMHPNLPTGTSTISLTDFRGLAAVTPSFDPFSQYNSTSTNYFVESPRALAQLSGNSVSVSTFEGTQNAPLSISLSDYLQKSQYQGTLSWAVDNAIFPTGTTFDTSTGVLTVDPTTTNGGALHISRNRNITATNRWGNSAQLSLDFQFDPTVVVTPQFPTGTFMIHESVSGQYVSKSVNLIENPDGVLQGGTPITFVTATDPAYTDPYPGYVLLKDVSTDKYLRHTGLNCFINDLGLGPIYDYVWKPERQSDGTFWIRNPYNSYTSFLTNVSGNYKITTTSSLFTFVPENFLPTTETNADIVTESINSHPYFTTLRGYRNAYITVGSNDIFVDDNGYYVIKLTVQGTVTYSDGGPVVWGTYQGTNLVKISVQTANAMRLAYVTKHSGNVGQTNSHTGLKSDGWGVPSGTLLYDAPNSVSDTQISDEPSSTFFFSFGNVIASAPEVVNGQYSIAFEAI